MDRTDFYLVDLRDAPYDAGWNDDSAWQETDSTEPSDGVEGDRLEPCHMVALRSAKGRAFAERKPT